MSFDFLDRRSAERFAELLDCDLDLQCGGGAASEQLRADLGVQRGRAAAQRLGSDVGVQSGLTVQHGGAAGERLSADVARRRGGIPAEQRGGPIDGRHLDPGPVDEELAELVTIGRNLAAARPRAHVDTEFRVGLRAMLIATAERDGIGITAVRAQAEPAAGHAAVREPGRGLLGHAARRRIRARGAIVIGVAAGALAVSGISAASESATPGDALYGVKRSTERAQLAMAGSDVTRGQLALDFARNRLAEATALGGSSGFAAVLDDMDADTRQGVRLLTTSAVDRKDNAPLETVDRFVTKQRIVLTPAAERLGPAQKKRAADSLALLDKVEERAEDLTARLSCDPIGRNGTDALGPKLDDCLADTGDSGVTEQPADKSEKQGSKSSSTGTGGTGGTDGGGDTTGTGGRSAADAAPSGAPVAPSATAKITAPGEEKPARSVGTPVTPSTADPPPGDPTEPDDPRAEEENDLLNGFVGGSRR